MAAVLAIGTPVTTPALKLPHVPGIELVPQRIPAEDEGELRWYLDDPVIASIRSGGGLGAALSRAESYGYGALPCRACGGRWRKRVRRRDGVEVIVDWEQGTGRRPKRRFGRQPTYATALAAYRLEQRRLHSVVLVTHHPEDEGQRLAVEEAFDKLGQVPMTEAEVRDVWDKLPEGETVECSVCEGLGVVPRRLPKHVEVTVWPTGSSRSGARVPTSADELVGRALNRAEETGFDRLFMADGYGVAAIGELERWKAVERILRDVAELSMVARVALEEYYAPRFCELDAGRAGSAAKRWGFGARPAAYEALWPLTTVGAGEVDGPAKSQRAREADAIYAHACGCYQIAAYGFGS